MTQIRHLEQAIARVTAEITRRVTPPPEEPPAAQTEQEARQERAPASASPGEATPSSPTALSWSAAVVLLCSIPGIGERTAIGILAEIGLNMRASPDGGADGPPSRGSAQAIMKVRASGYPAKRAKAIPGCDVF